MVLSIGAIIQASSFTVAQLIAGRIVAGVGLGLMTSNVIVWQSESAPRQIRGMLVASSLSLLIVGQVRVLPLRHRSLNLVALIFV
jgi:MFS family permease